MKKILILIYLIFNVGFLFPVVQVCNPCDPVDDSQDKNKIIYRDLLENFTPDFLITEQLPEDLEILKKMKPLFFETALSSGNSKRDVYTRAIKDQGAQEIVLLTNDDFRISSLYFKRENAPINIVYITGYFQEFTPLKEWCTPFSVIFDNFNILSFDWRGFGDSEGRKGKWTGNEFGTGAYLDIQAAVDFFRKENDKPIVLIGFCLGAAMAMKATVEAQKNNKNVADALVLNSIFTEFENQFNRAVSGVDKRSNTLSMKFLLNARAVGAFVLDNIVILGGSLFDLKPIEMIEQINIPCYFEHFTSDPFAIIEEGIIVFGRTSTFKMFSKFDKGRHVRMHTVTPWQYKQSFYSFLSKSGLLKNKEI